MQWIAIGIIAGSLVVSEHKDKEACEGRAAMLREQKVAVKCVEAPGQGISISSGTSLCYGPNGMYRAC